MFCQIVILFVHCGPATICDIVHCVILQQCMCDIVFCSLVRQLQPSATDPMSQQTQVLLSISIHTSTKDKIKYADVKMSQSQVMADTNLYFSSHQYHRQDKICRCRDITKPSHDRHEFIFLFTPVYWKGSSTLP